MKKIVMMLATVLLGTLMATTVFAETSSGVWSETTVRSNTSMSTVIESDGTVTDGVLEITFDASALSCQQEDVKVADAVDMYSVNVENERVRISFLADEEITAGEMIYVTFGVINSEVDLEKALTFSGDVHNAKGESVSVKANTTIQKSEAGNTENPENTEETDNSSEESGNHSSNSSESSSSNQNESNISVTVTVNGNSGWDHVIEELNRVPDGGNVTVKMSASTVLSHAVLDAIKGKDVNLVIVMENGVSWKINGKSITSDNMADIDLNVALNVNVIPQDVVESIADGKTFMELSLSYDGAFPFDATLILNVGAENAGQYANLYYYNPSTGKMEFQTSARIDAAGDTELLFTHASDYILVIDNVAAVDTGDTSNFAVPMLAICMGCVLAAAGLRRKKIMREDGTK